MMADTPMDRPTGTDDTAHDTGGDVTPETSAVSDVTTGPEGPTLSLGEAVRTTGAARSTIQRRLNSGAIPGATRTDAGGWSIPVSGLIAAGLAPRVTPADTPPDTTPDTAPATPLPEGDTAVVSDLRAELAATRMELDHARRLADERARHVDDLRAALDAMARALPPAPETPPGDAVGAAPGDAVGTPPRRRWWSR
jgi:hypothetical protein